MKIHFQILVLENTIPCLKYKIHQELEVIALHEVVELKYYTIKLFEEVKEHFLKIQRKCKLVDLTTNIKPKIVAAIHPVTDTKRVFNTPTK